MNTILAAAWCAAILSSSRGGPAADPPLGPIVRAVAIDGVSSWGRRSINVDAVAAAIVAGDLADGAREGDTLDVPAALSRDAQPAARAWRTVDAGEGGEFRGLRPGSYVLAEVESDGPRVVILHARGHSMVYVNGVPRIGDPYSSGNVRIPIALRPGRNVLVFAASGRGAFHAALEVPRAPVMLLTDDVVAPDAVRGDPGSMSVEVGLLNTTAQPRRARLEVVEPVAAASREVTIAPLTRRRARVELPAFDPGAGDTLRLKLRVREADGAADNADSGEVSLRVAPAGGARRVAFTSEIDGSLQYYAVVPARRGEPEVPTAAPGLLLSLHGAGVEALGQAHSYAAKPDMLIVCPTNRRPFGFDWEDWGRVDAIEAMNDAAARFGTDPLRQWVTGHSMGGHGAWQLGVLCPGRFAAVAPSAGWISFDSYAGGRRGAGVGESVFDGVIARAGASSDTLSRFETLRGRGVYILHGDADDNVPVREARAARDELSRLGIAFEYHEQPGAGHWWGSDALPQPNGAACVDWPPMFDLFRRSALRAPAPASIESDLLDATGLPRGSFKRAFARRFALVYGTRGDPAENAASLAKARFDLEQWWYRGNGDAELIPDTEAAAIDPSRNLVIYGSAEVNAAWTLVDPSARVFVGRGTARAGDASWTGDDVGVLAVVPRRGGGTIGIVAGSGVTGQRSLDRLPYFTSGAAFPQVFIIRASAWTQGLPAVLHAE